MTTNLSLEVLRVLEVRAGLSAVEIGKRTGVGVKVVRPYLALLRANGLIGVALAPNGRERWALLHEGREALKSAKEAQR